MTNDRADELVDLLSGIIAELDSGEASIDRLEQILNKLDDINQELPVPALK